MKVVSSVKTSNGTITNFITIPIRIPIPHQNSDSDSDTCNEFMIIFRPQTWFKKQTLFVQSTFISYAFRRNMNGFVTAKKKTNFYMIK